MSKLRDAGATTAGGAAQFAASAVASVQGRRPGWRGRRRVAPVGGSAAPAPAVSAGGASARASGRTTYGWLRRGL